MQMDKLKSLFISKNYTIKQAMLKLIETSERILLVVEDENILKGTVTDGDIRRALIRGSSFGESIGSVMKETYHFISHNQSNYLKKLKEIMIQGRLEQVPVIDEDRRIRDLILWTDIFDKESPEQSGQSLNNRVVIMAGGKGTRLEPFTSILPKPLIPIEDKPVIEIIMNRFHKYGINDFTLILNYKKEYIKTFLKESEFPYKVDWIDESDFMGTVGGLSLLDGRVKDTFILTNCDIIVQADYEDMIRWHKEHKNLMTIVGSHREVQIPYGVLKLDQGKLTAIDEKPNYDVLINTGLYVLEPEVLSLIPKDKKMDMDELVRVLAEKGHVSVYPISNGWFDIGQWDKYRHSLKKFNELSS